MTDTTGWPDPMFAEDVARVRGTSVDAVYAAKSRGKLPTAARVGRRLAWRRADIEEWFDSQREHA